MLRPGRNPAWLLLRRPRSSSVWRRRSEITFSRIFPIHEVREIGLYDTVSFGSFPSLRLGLMIAVRHWVGIPSPDQHLLKMSSSLSMASGPRCLMSSYGMLSSPGALLFFACRMTRIISCIVRGISHPSSPGFSLFSSRFLFRRALSECRTGRRAKLLYVLANCSALSLSST